MRERTIRRTLLALGCEPFTPTEDQRELVRVLSFNGVERDRIAEILELRPIELAYHFRRELDLSEDYYLAQAASTVIELAKQRSDLGVALRASEAMLRARSSRWREPRAIDPGDEGRPIETMSLIEVDHAIAELERRRRDHAPPADPQAAADDVEGEPEGMVQDGRL